MIAERDGVHADILLWSREGATINPTTPLSHEIHESLRQPRKTRKARTISILLRYDVTIDGVLLPILLGICQHSKLTLQLYILRNL